MTGLTEVQACFLAGLFVVIACAGVVSLDNYHIRKRLSSIEKSLVAAERGAGDGDEGTGEGRASAVPTLLVVMGGVLVLLGFYLLIEYTGLRSYATASVFVGLAAWLDAYFVIRKRGELR